MEFYNFNPLTDLKSSSKYNLVTDDNWSGIDILAYYFINGLKNNEKCICITNYIDTEGLSYELQKLGVDIGHYLKKKQFEFVSIKKFYNQINSKKDLNIYYEKEIEDALAAGFNGYRISINRGLYFDELYTEKDYISMEKIAEDIINKLPFTILYQYNYERIINYNIMDVLKLNPKFIYRSFNKIIFENIDNTISINNIVEIFVNIQKQLFSKIQDIKKQNYIYKLLCNLTNELYFKDNIREILTTILREIAKACVCDMGIIVLFKNCEYNIKEDILVHYNVPDKLLELINGKEFIKHINIMLKDKSYISIDSDEIIDRRMLEINKSINIKSTLVIPVKFKNLSVGFINLCSNREGFSFKSQINFLSDYFESVISILYNQIKIFNTSLEIKKIEKAKALGIISSGVAHEFNNLLTPILGYAQLIKKKSNDANIIEYADYIEKNAEDGSSVVKRLKEFSKKEDSSLKERLNINDIILTVLCLTKLKWKNEAEVIGKKINIIKNLDSKGYIYANSSELREVITNLILNAIDAIEKDGEIKIKSWDEEDYVYFYIQDNGTGMNDKVLENIFTPFYTTKKEKGTGLGLFISYNIINSYDGDIKVWSKLNEGTKFEIKLPICTSNIAQNVVDNNSKIRNIKGNVLVIDDQISVSKITACMLEEIGLKVDTINDGKAAINKFKEKKYDLVLCDLAMPEITGIDVSKMLKDLNKDIKIIIMTGWNGDIEEKDKKYFDYILDKPFSLKELSFTISKFL